MADSVNPKSEKKRKTKAAKEPKQPYHVRMAEAVIKALEDGTAPWIKPWEPGQLSLRPYNPVTEKEYKGWNSVWLEMDKPGNDPRFCTYKQAEAQGWQVRKGAKGSVIQYWKTTDRKLLKDENGQPKLDDKGEKQYVHYRLERPKAFCAVVFNGADIEGIPDLPPPKLIPDEQRHEQAELMLSASEAAIFHDQNDRAFYRSISDEIHLPPSGQFHTPDSYYVTALHEMAHSTGHSSRLDRDMGNVFGSPEYAKEELRAEMASYMLGQELGIGHDPGQHHAYIENWVEVLKNDPLEIMRAAKDAQDIMEYMMERMHEKAVSQASELSTEEPDQITANAVPTIEEERSMRDTWLAQQHHAPPDPATEKTWLAIPFEDYQQAKISAGMLDDGTPAISWDGSAKSWYANPGADMNLLQQYLPENIPDRQEPALDPVQEFRDACHDAGLILSGEHPIMDGQSHRVPAEGDKKGQTSGEYKGFLDQAPAGFIINYRTDYREPWKATGQKLDKETLAKQRAEFQIKAEQRRKEQAQQHHKAAQTAQQQWNTMQPLQLDHPYLRKKGLDYSPSFLAKQDQRGNLVLPIRDRSGEIRCLQHIWAQGNKQFTQGADKQGCFHVIGGRKALKQQGKNDPLLITTGFATAASLHQASGKPVVVAFNDANLKAVAQTLKQAFPDHGQALFGDDDHHLTQRPQKPLPNSGREKTEEAAAAIGGIAVFPLFKDGPNADRTDFNDLQREEGLAVVKRQVELGLEMARNRGRETAEQRQQENTLSGGEEGLAR